jgi:hypothetical protein
MSRLVRRKDITQGRGTPDLVLGLEHMLIEVPAQA